MLTLLSACGKKDDSGSKKNNRSANPTTPELCPNGYANVPDAADGFCVMKYEAKVGGDSLPVSTAENAPWTGTFAPDAQALCQALGPKYDLISNEEWLTIARNAEAQGSNWTGGSVGSGCLFRGNDGGPMPWNNCGYGNGAGGVDFGVSRNARAKLILSNGEEVWDLAGNVSEWVDWEAGGSFDLAPLGCQQVGTEFRDVAADLGCPLVESDYSPLNINHGSTEGMGIFVGGMGGYARRGGASWGGASSGVYALGLERGGANNDGDNGFRCVYRR